MRFTKEKCEVLRDPVLVILTTGYPTKSGKGGQLGFLEKERHWLRYGRYVRVNQTRLKRAFQAEEIAYTKLFINNNNNNKIMHIV